MYSQVEHIVAYPALLLCARSGIVGKDFSFEVLILPVLKKGVGSG